MYGIKLTGTDLWLRDSSQNDLHFAGKDNLTMSWHSRKEAMDYIATVCRIEGLEVVLLTDE